MSKDELIQYVKRFPDKPGVYLMRDADFNIIYIGKAKSLKKRVLSYFRHQNFASPRLRKLVDTICDISTIRVESEIEALLLENRLIKLYQPFFNVDLKMNERYGYVKVTDEKFSRLEFTRIVLNDGGNYIGPFVRVGEVKLLLRLIEKFMPLRTCKYDLTKHFPTRPCMKYSLGRCLGPCAGKCSEKEYKERVADIILLLQGNTLQLTEKLRQRMDHFAKSMQFEEAAKIRNTIRALWRVSRQKHSTPDTKMEEDNYLVTLINLQKIFHLPLIPWRIDCFDISHTGGKETVGVVVVFEQGYPNPSLYRRFNLQLDKLDDFRSIEETVKRRYKKILEGQAPLPQLILIDGGAEQLVFAKKALVSLQIKVPLLALAEKNEEIYTEFDKNPIQLTRNDETLRLLQRIRDEAHRFAITNHRNRRDTLMQHSRLEDISGVSHSKALLLIAKFGSAKNVSQASIKELETVDGIGKKLAKNIFEYFHAEEIS